MEAKESQGTACITESPGSHSQDIKPGFEGSEEVTCFKHSIQDDTLTETCSRSKYPQPNGE